MRLLTASFLCLFLSAVFAAAAEEPNGLDSAAADPNRILSAEEQENALIEQLTLLDPADPDYQTKLRQISDELRLIEQQRRSAEPFPAPDSGMPAPNPFSAPPASPAPGVSPQNVPFSPFDGMDAVTLRQLHFELTSQMKYLNRVLDTLGADDEGLSSSLREQKEELTGRLKEIESRLGGAPSDSGMPPAGEGNALSRPGDANPAPAAGSGAADQNLYADPAAAPFGGGMFGETFGNTAADPTAVDGAWYTSENKNQQILDAVSALAKSNEETQRKLDEVLDELKTIETQLKLLSRQAVTGQ
ncbi:MAG: hypothetical protein IJG60_09310 [Thermoguttaceae bacterium]|nr:hypothetical protein [Thermoguttaceae bacterium]